MAKSPSVEPLNIAVVGAGISGLTAAKTLHANGHSVAVYDKSHAVGGRTSVRRNGRFSFDHGAQYFTIQDPRFARFVKELIDSGEVAQWNGQIVNVRGDERRPSEKDCRYIGVPGMNAVAKNLATDLRLRLSTRVGRIRAQQPGWNLTDDNDRDLGHFDALVIALPSKQAADLSAKEVAVNLNSSESRFVPCWAVMLGFETALPTPFDGAFVDASPLAWIARNNSKPGRPPGESWVLHASSEWSIRHLESRPEIVIKQLTEEFARLTDSSSVHPVYQDAHRWRYALTAQPLQTKNLAHERERLVVCGDWCYGARVEDAFLSGIAAAESLIASADITV